IRHGDGASAAHRCLKLLEIPNGLFPSRSSAGTMSPMSGPATYQGSGCVNRCDIWSLSARKRIGMAKSASRTPLEEHNGQVSSRRDFLKQAGSMGLGLGGPALASCLQGRAEAADLAGSQAVTTGKAQHITILHTSDIHAQLEIHDEFFYEEGRPAFRRRGGIATLCTMIDALRRQNPQHTLVVDGGDCFQGSAVAALSKGQAIPPLL